MGLKSSLHNFREKNKDKKWLPAFSAIHTFLFLPNETTHNGTHIKAADDLKRTMNTSYYGNGTVFNLRNV